MVRSSSSVYPLLFRSGAVIDLEALRQPGRLSLASAVTPGAGRGGGAAGARVHTFPRFVRMVLADPAAAHAKPALHGNSASALIEIHNLAPIQPGVDPANAAAFGALKVCRDVPPIPIGEVRQIEPAVVMASAVISVRQFRRSKAVDQNGLKPGISAYWAGPVFKVIGGFSAPGHDASKRRASCPSKSLHRLG